MGTTSNGSGTPPAGLTQTQRDDITTAQGDSHPQYHNENAKTSEGDRESCGTSAGINGDYDCSGTRGLIAGAQVTNMVTQAAGSVATQALGQSQAMQAQAEGTQSAAMHAAATTQRTSGEIQMGAGALNAAMGVLQIVSAQKHKGYISDINKATDGDRVDVDGFNKSTGNLNITSADGTQSGNAQVKGGDATQQHVIDHFHLQGQIRNNVSITTQQATANSNLATSRNQEIHNRASEMQQELSNVKRNMTEIGTNAANEQKAVANAAMAGGMMSLVTGAGQLMSGGFNIAAAGQMDDAANKLANMENGNGAPTIMPLGNQGMQPGDALAPGNTTTISGNGQTDPASQDATAAPSGDPGGGLGNPIGPPLAGGGPGNAPTAGKFTNTGPGQGSGGGGGGGGDLGGASTQAAAPGGDDNPQAKLADNRGNPGYDSGGTFQGGGGGRNGADGGPDLSSLLAQFLPKKDEEQKNQNGILDFGSRSPASEQPLSLLDKNANIFDRIHETYQDKSRHGNVGL